MTDYILFDIVKLIVIGCWRSLCFSNTSTCTSPITQAKHGCFQRDNYNWSDIEITTHLTTMCMIVLQNTELLQFMGKLIYYSRVRCDYCSHGSGLYLILTICHHTLTQSILLVVYTMICTFCVVYFHSFNTGILNLCA